MDEKLTRDRFFIASKKLIEMREKKILTDVVLKCRGGNIFAHRCVLMATNQYFYDMFTQNLHGDTQFEFDYTDISVHVMSTIVATLYGEVPRELKGDTKQIINVLETSYLINEKLLFKYCLTLLTDKLTVENCIEVWNVTVKYHEDKEEYRVMGFILDHLSEMVKFNKLIDVSADQMSDFVSYAAGILDKGDQLLLVVVAWGKRNQAERFEKVIPLFRTLEKLQFVNYPALRFELEYFAQSSGWLKARLQPLMKRFSQNCRNRNMVKRKNSYNIRSEPTPNRIPPPPSSVSSLASTCRNLISARRKPSRPICSNAFVSPPPSSIGDSSMIRKSRSSSTETFKTATTSFETNDIQVHFFHLVQSPICKMSLDTYSIADNVWSSEREIPLPNFISKTWYPLVSSDSERYYFGITNTKNFVAFSESTGDAYIGPTVSFRSQVSGVSDGSLMYVWNYEFIGQFNSELREWKSLLPNLNIVSNCSNLVAINGGLYIHVVFPPILYKYDFDLESWTVKKVFPEQVALKSIKCKCCHRETCKGELYFYTNEKQLIIYDLVNDVYRTVFLPELESGMPLLMSCDQSFIIFVDKNKLEYFFYYPETNEIKYLEKCWSQLENMNLVTCDLSVL